MLTDTEDFTCKKIVWYHGPRIIWNLCCPLLYREVINYCVIPTINDYLLEYSVLGVSPPEIDNMSIKTAYLLVFLQTIRYVL